MAGTRLFDNGHVSRSGNPIANAACLAANPAVTNPFFTGKTLAVRYGDLTQGAAAQFTGTATRIGDSNRFKVHLAREGESANDEWVLTAIAPATAFSSSMLFLNAFRVGQGELPLTGKALNVIRASVGDKFDLNVSFGDPADPSKCGIDVTAFPVFASKIKIATFDAHVVA